MFQRPLVDVRLELEPLPLLSYYSEDVEGERRGFVDGIPVSWRLGSPPLSRSLHSQVGRTEPVREVVVRRGPY